MAGRRAASFYGNEGPPPPTTHREKNGTTWRGGVEASLILGFHGCGRAVASSRSAGKSCRGGQFSAISWTQSNATTSNCVQRYPLQRCCASSKGRSRRPPSRNQCECRALNGAMARGGTRCVAIVVEAQGDEGNDCMCITCPQLLQVRLP